jgi:hypothetical protein
MRRFTALLLLSTACHSRAATPAQAPAATATASLEADSTWQQHDAASDAALAASDYRGYLYHLRALEAPLSGHPGVVYGIARAHALMGARDSALAWLTRFAAMGLVRDVAGDSAFAAFRGTAAFARITERLAANAAPVGRSETVLSLPDSTLLIEDVAWDPRSRTWYLSSVHQRRILTIGPDGATRDLVPAAGSGLLSPFAIALDTARNLLWVTSAGTPEGLGIRQEDLGTTAVLSFEMPSGRLAGRYDLPADSTPRALADLDLLDDGTLIVSDSRGGGLYRLTPGRGLAQLVAPGTFRSPQGPAGIPGTPYVLVADYLRGIARVDRRAGALSWLPHPPDLAVSGIDGLRLTGRRLIAVQNGIRPGRVVQLTLDERLESIVSWKVLEAGTPGFREPTHGIMMDGQFVFVANSGWAAMGEDGNFRAGAELERPVIRRIRLAR